MKIDHAAIEKKWQDRWAKDGVFRAEEKRGEKFYGLVEFPYPSADGLHVGHPRSYTAIDAVTRKRRMEGKNVLYPIGWDAFGLPAENYAIKHKIKPREATTKNIANFKRQLQSLGFGFDWSREINTTDPAYFKWTQWQFLQFFKHGLAYKGTSTINWCPKDKIGLANEEAAGGVCERCGTKVEKREKHQWMLAITKYAERLISDLESVDYLPQIKAQQINWIGKSEGAKVTFSLVDVPGQEDGKHSMTVFTTRPDTLFGVTFLVISPERAKLWLDVGWQAPDAVRSYVELAIVRVDVDRADGEKEKTGIATGVSALHPVTGEKIPVWVSDYVLGNVGTGAIMAVPGHDERDFAFAQKFGLPIKKVVVPLALDRMPVLNVVPTVQQTDLRVEAECYAGEGESVNSDFLDGLMTSEAKEKMITWLEKQKKGERAVTYKLRDWVFSRQRYWGEPIPIINCAKCGFVPVPDNQLPVTLPDVPAYEPTDTGESPLANIREWVEVACPTCGGPAERETDTMPNWAGSSWYFLRYCDPHNEKVFADPKKLKYWLPIDLYNGGMEHTTLHLLYSRFWYKFLWDVGLIPKACGSEPYARRRSHGMVLAQGGEKMSKSKGNVINPDDVVTEHGADVCRVYEMFMGPFDEAIPWSTESIIGVRRFLEKVATVSDRVSLDSDEGVRQMIHQTVAKVSSDIEAMKFNTAVSQMMICVNTLTAAKQIAKDDWLLFVRVLSPFAPHLAEELWEQAGGDGYVAHAAWPTADPRLLTESEVEIIVQVNGRVRDTFRVPRETSPDAIESLARSREKVVSWIAGRTIQKAVVIPGRLVNIVIDETPGN